MGEENIVSFSYNSTLKMHAHLKNPYFANNFFQAIQIDQDDNIELDDVYNSTIEESDHYSKSHRSSLQQLLPTPMDVKSVKSSVHESLKAS